MSRKKLILLVALGAFVMALPVLLAVGAGGLAIFLVSKSTSTSYVTSPDRPGVREVSTHDRSTSVRHEWREIQKPDGTWVKDGPSVGRNRQGKMLEEGSYRDGKREGEWTFWNEDGSIDLVRSGIYENDVRVQEGTRPAGY